MARITLLSFLFTLVTLLQLATTSTARGYYKLISAGSSGWAKNFAESDRTVITQAIVDKNDSGKNEQWEIRKLNVLWTFKNAGSEFYLDANSGFVIGVPASINLPMWEVIRSPTGSMAIKVPNRDLFMTARQGRDGKIAIYVDPENGTKDQEWFMKRIADESDD
ncbi:hypothetical protein BGZ76_000233 [Entomortierella beljakovae]|nr:hypothetical protein BGZ76_000233 [Entomortierella beljakovae]